MSKIYWGLLQGPQEREIKKLKHFSHIGVLFGGTALALQIRHRLSEDLDVFLGKGLPHNLLIEIRKVFGRNIEIVEEFHDQLTFTTETGAKITFVNYPFKSLFPVVKTPYLPFSHWKDIALDKAYTVGHRPLWRDYVDLFFLLKYEISLPWVITNAREKFGGLFSEKLFLGQLTYFEDLRMQKIDFIENERSTKEVQTFLGKQVEDYTRKKINP